MRVWILYLSKARVSDFLTAMLSVFLLNLIIDLPSLGEFYD